MRERLRRLIRGLGYDIHRADPFPLGRDPFRDARRILRDVCELCVFDIGANVGQTIEQIRRSLSAARVHAFEPTPAAYAQLEKRAGGLEGVTLNSCAMGAAPGRLVLHEYASSAVNSFLEPGDDWSSQHRGDIPVTVDTVDEYCSRHGVERVHVLKSDTQGYELQVLQGAARMIREDRIDLVLVEINFQSYYKGQASAGALIDWLAHAGFLPASFYGVHRLHGRGAWTDGLFLRRSLRIVEDDK